MVWLMKNQLHGSLIDFVFSCPEAAPVRLKMMSSTCKATVLDATTRLDIAFDHIVRLCGTSFSRYHLTYLDSLKFAM